MAHQGSVVEKTWGYAPVAHPGFQDIFSRQWQTYIASRLQEAFQLYNTFLSLLRIRSTLGVYTTAGSIGIAGVRRKIRAGVWHAVWTGCGITACEGRLWLGQGGSFDGKSLGVAGQIYSVSTKAARVFGLGGVDSMTACTRRNSFDSVMALGLWPVATIGGWRHRASCTRVNISYY